MLRRLAFASLMLVGLAACATSIGPSGPGGIFAAPVHAAWENNPQGGAWTAATRAAIDADGTSLVAATPKDIAAYCPRYGADDPAVRRDFWVVTLSQIAQTESGLVASKASAAGGRGLLQISLEGARRYGCAVNSEADLLDPIRNLTCGVKILAATSGQDGYVAGYSGGWRGASRYWVDLRKPEAVADLQSLSNAQSFCAAPRA